MSERAVRIAVVLMLALAGVAAWDSERHLDARRGEAYPGFYVIASRIVAPPVNAQVSETLARSGLSSFDQIESVEGERVERPSDLRRVALRAGPGTPLRYGVRTPGGARKEVSIETRVLDANEEPATKLMFAIGTAWLLVGAAPLLARPRERDAQLFFVFSWAIACNFGFLAVDHLVLHRFQPWSFAISTLAIATLIHLAFTFPERRRPFRSAPGRKLLALYAPAPIGFVAFAAVSWFRPDVSYFPTLGALALYLVGTVFLIGNITLAFFRPSRPIDRQRARVALFLPAFAGGSASSLAWLAGWGGAEIGAAAFFAGNVTVPAAIAWATYQHDYFDIDAVVRRGLAVGAAALIVSLGFLGVFAWLRSWFGLETATASAALALGLVCAAVPLSQPLRRRLQVRIDELLYPGRSRSLTVITEAIRSLAEVRDRAGVAALVVAAAREAVHAQRAHVVAGAGAGTLEEIGAGDVAIRIPPGDPIALAVRRGAVVDVEGEAQPKGRELRRRLREIGVSLLVPIPAQSGHVAALLLGPPAEGRPYGRFEQRLLESLGAQAGIALGSAEAWDELAALRSRLRRDNVALRREIARHRGFEEIVGDAPGIAAAREQVAQVADTATTVLVLGETGTGKELIVRALHRLSDRAERPLVRVACAAIPETLLESELFGHEKGAFTDAVGTRVGRFEVADGGTIFLDDVDTLPLPVQAKLLRALQEGEVQRLGSNDVRVVDVRTVSATNRDLREEVRAGRFREDLYYRLHVVPIRLPPLRERPDDIPLLVQHFIEIESAKLGRSARPISTSALEAICRYEWPGNVRELRNVIERAVVMSRGDVVELGAELGARPAGHAESSRTPRLDERPLADRVREFKAECIRSALARNGGNLTKAAAQLGLHRQSLSRMVRDLGIPRDAEPAS